MIDCDQFNRALPYLIADEVEPGSRAGCWRTLGSAMCAGGLRIDRSLRQGLHETSLQQAPTCPPRVRATIERSFRRRRLARTGAGLGGLAAAAALGLFMLQPTGDRSILWSTPPLTTKRDGSQLTWLSSPLRGSSVLDGTTGRRVSFAHRPAPRTGGASCRPRKARRRDHARWRTQRVDVLAVEPTKGATLPGAADDQARRARGASVVS